MEAITACVRLSPNQRFESIKGHTGRLRSSRSAAAFAESSSGRVVVDHTSESCQQAAAEECGPVLSAEAA